jgi:heat-inducible transcriptional repressor
MDQLTDRQTQLLKIVIEDYISSAKPVGSVEMVANHGLKISAATVRNEMVRLIERGLLYKTHSSSGRVPTPTGLRIYLDSLMEEVPLPVLTEVAIKQRLWQERFEFEKFLRKLTLALAENTGYLSFVSTGDEHIFSAGSVNILNHPEFFDIEVTRAVLGLLDHEDVLTQILSKSSGKRDLHVLMGEELGNPNLSQVAIVFSTVSTFKSPITFGVIGPIRMEYKKALPLLKFFRSLAATLGSAS